MLSKFQSVKAISNQVEQGFEYFIISYKETPVGYLSFIKKKDTLFLSKIYILSDYRGKKIGKTAMRFIEEKARKMDCNKVGLTVNKHNDNSIKAYKKLAL